MKPTLASLFPNASQSTAKINPHLMGDMGNDLALGRGPTNKNDAVWRTGSGNGKRGMMNKTESEFGLMLEAQKRSGEILRYEFEGITLRWADMRYTPDFVIFDGNDECSMPIKLIEVKGGHIWDRDIVRFKGARAYWPEMSFEMWQLKKGQGWKRKY